MADGVWKGVYLLVFGSSHQFLLNRFFDPSTPTMRKVDDGEKKKKMMVFTVAVVASRLPTDWNSARSCQYFT